MNNLPIEFKRINRGRKRMGESDFKTMFDLMNIQAIMFSKHILWMDERSMWVYPKICGRWTSWQMNGVKFKIPELCALCIDRIWFHSYGSIIVVHRSTWHCIMIQFLSRLIGQIHSELSSKSSIIKCRRWKYKLIDCMRLSTKRESLSGLKSDLSMKFLYYSQVVDSKSEWLVFYFNSKIAISILKIRTSYKQFLLLCLS